MSRLNQIEVGGVTYDLQDSDVSNCIPKVTSATNNHIATFNTGGTIKDSGKLTTDFESAMSAVSKTGSVTLTVADNTNYTMTSVTSLNMTGANVTCMGTITFGSSTPSISVSGFTATAGDNITSAAASEVWEFNCLKGRVVWKKWG